MGHRAAVRAAHRGGEIARPSSARRTRRQGGEPFGRPRRKTGMKPSPVSARLLAALCLFVAAPAAADSRTLDFDVLRKGASIGTHRVSIRTDGPRTEVSIEIDLEVRFAFLTLYRYTHRARETWDADRLVALEASTDDNGTRTNVAAPRHVGRHGRRRQRRALHRTGRHLPHKLLAARQGPSHAASRHPERQARLGAQYRAGRVRHGGRRDRTAGRDLPHRRRTLRRGRPMRTTAAGPRSPSRRAGHASPMSAARRAERERPSSAERSARPVATAKWPPPYGTRPQSDRISAHGGDSSLALPGSKRLDFGPCVAAGTQRSGRPPTRTAPA